MFDLSSKYFVVVVDVCTPVIRQTKRRITSIHFNAFAFVHSQSHLSLLLEEERKRDRWYKYPGLVM